MKACHLFEAKMTNNLTKHQENKKELHAKLIQCNKHVCAHNNDSCYA